MSKAMTLDAWLTEHPDLEGKLVEALDCHPKSVWRYRTGRKMPHQDAMRLIYAFTKGAVDPNSFYDLPEIKPDRSRAKRAS